MKMTVGAFVAAAVVGLSACQPTTTTTTTIVPAGQVQMNVINRSGVTAFYVYISPCSSSTWGIDRLGSNVLSNGETRSITLPAGCYDLKASDNVTDPNEPTWVERNVNIGVGAFDWTLRP
ncbi:MAG: hypothetical protein AAGL89_10015 [Pseudomonadota bacterium]